MMEAEKPPVTRRDGVANVRVGEAIANDLRERILRGEFEEGALPKQEALMREFGVSAPSIREAFRVLEAEGLIEVRRGNVGGATVRRPDAATTARALGLSLHSQRVSLGDLSDAMWSMEPVAAMQCAAQTDQLDDIVAELERNCDRTEASLRDADERTWAATAQEFHEVMTNRCGNLVLQVMLRSLFALWGSQQEDWRAHNHSMFVSLADRRRVVSTHRKIAAAIRAGDGRRAERLERAHMGEIRNALLAPDGVNVSVTRGHGLH